MDFFAQQDVARKKSGRLVFLFVLAVVLIVAAVYVAAMLILHYSSMKSGNHGAAAPVPPLQIWQPRLFFTVSAMVLMAVGSATLFKILALRKGGSYVAESLGGRPVTPDTTDRDERKLLNVVEEIAIAAGVPVPAVYVLQGEEGINAFAAGWSTADAAIAVTSGCLHQLNRDELQGVIAHEFSHILNGDMRLNIKLIGFISGIMVLATIGYYMMYVRPRRDSKGAAALVIGALSLLAIGYGGAFVARIIQSAVSRQREYLADSSAVQFTRNPAGIANALKKIGGYEVGSVIKAPSAKEVRHMFFGPSDVVSFFGSVFATHPPLPDRIKRLDPSFDGDYSRLSPVPGGVGDVAGAAGLSGPSGAAAGQSGSMDQPRRVARASDTASIAGSLGTLTREQVEAGAGLLASMPEPVRRAVQEPLGACAVVCAMLLDPDEDIRAVQMESLSRTFSPMLAREAAVVMPHVAKLDRDQALPVVDLALPALRRMSRSQYVMLTRAIAELVHADSHVTLFEFCLQKVIEFRLFSAFERPNAGTASVPFAQLAADASVLLSAVASAGTEVPESAVAAFDAGVKSLFAGRVPTGVMKYGDYGFDMLDNALNRFAGAPLKVRRQVFLAVSDCVLHDAQITVEELELLRAVAYCFGLPLPPFAVAA